MHGEYDEICSNEMHEMHDLYFFQITNAPTDANKISANQNILPECDNDLRKIDLG